LANSVWFYCIGALVLRAAAKAGFWRLTQSPQRAALKIVQKLKGRQSSGGLFLGRYIYVLALPLRRFVKVTDHCFDLFAIHSFAFDFTTHSRDTSVDYWFASNRLSIEPSDGYSPVIGHRLIPYADQKSEVVMQGHSPAFVLPFVLSSAVSHFTRLAFTVVRTVPETLNLPWIRQSKPSESPVFGRLSASAPQIGQFVMGFRFLLPQPLPRSAFDSKTE